MGPLFGAGMAELGCLVVRWAAAAVEAVLLGLVRWERVGVVVVVHAVVATAMQVEATDEAGVASVVAAETALASREKVVASLAALAVVAEWATVEAMVARVVVEMVGLVVAAVPSVVTVQERRRSERPLAPYQTRDH